MAKALGFILRSVYLTLLEMFQIDCYVVRKISENLAGRDDFSNFASCCCEIM